MEKERLIELLSTHELTAEELNEISKLVLRYPWFNLAHFLKLKALRQLDHDLGENLELTAVFSSDRRHLYHWINNEIDLSASSISMTHKELEFIGEDDHSESGLFGSSEDAFELDAEEDEIQFADKSSLEDEEDLKGVVVKEEVDMEEPDIKEEATLPVMDQVKEREDIGETESEDEIEELTQDIDSVQL